MAAFGSIVIGTVVALTPIVSGVLFFLDPLLRKRPNFKGADANGFLSVATLQDLPDDGTPTRFVLRADRVDAWNQVKDQSIGTIFLRKMPENQVIAFNDTCPHLGCKVEFNSGSQSFLCPCHASAFRIDGNPTNAIPPRGLDTLEAKVEPDGRIWIKYEEFEAGKTKKKAIG
jgi:Rieske Fe-S protein